MSENTVVSVSSGDVTVSSRTEYVAAGALAWCAACREWTEFVVPTGLSDADRDELACLQCGWAVLVSVGLREAPVPRGRGTGRQAA